MSTEGLFIARGDLSDVVLNWYGQPMEKFDSYAEAYHSTARRLFEKSSPDEVRDINACPVVFLYRQSLELYLKEILINGHRLLRFRPDNKLVLQEKDIFDMKHNLCKLWQELKTLYERLDWRWEADLDAEGEIIKEFNDIDPNSFSFRYPVKKDGSPTTAQPDRVEKSDTDDKVKAFRFDLCHFCSRMDQVLSRLEEMSVVVGGELDPCCDFP